jgi:hypothetical protein
MPAATTATALSLHRRALFLRVLLPASAVLHRLGARIASTTTAPRGIGPTAGGAARAFALDLRR